MKVPINVTRKKLLQVSTDLFHLSTFSLIYIFTYLHFHLFAFSLSLSIFFQTGTDKENFTDQELVSTATGLISATLAPIVSDYQCPCLEELRGIVDIPSSTEIPSCVKGKCPIEYFRSVFEDK